MVTAMTAIPLCAAGALLEGWAVVVLGWRRALDISAVPADPHEPRLVLGGPFRHVRHPQSLGLLLLVIGVAVATRSAGMWVVAGIAGILVIAMAVRHDRELARDCGESYARYRRVVPFIVPRLR